jgi:hypothetical protein
VSNLRITNCPTRKLLPAGINLYPDDIDNLFLSGYIYSMSYTVFHGFRKVADGEAAQVSLFLKDKRQGGDFLVFDDATGQQTDLDKRGTPNSISTDEANASAEPRGRGRPRLGVMPREVTLLPRHWDWLAVQPGGASVALRKLVDEARRTSGDRDRVRAAQEATYRFISAIAGNLPGFEEATRSLFAYDRRRFSDLIAGWPEDIRDYAIKLAFADQIPAAGPDYSRNPLDMGAPKT